MSPTPEISDKLDQILQDIDETDPPADPPAADPPAADPPAADPPADDPPGFLNYEEWVTAGKDPDDYRGKNAYNREYQSIQDNRELRTDIKDMKKLVTQMVSHTDEVNATAIETGRKQIIQELEDAKASGDVDAALDAAEKLNALKQPSTDPVTSKHPKMLELTAATHILDPEHDDYEQEFAADFGIIYNGWLTKMSQNPDIQLTDIQIEKAWNASLEDAKQLNPGLFKSAKRSRPTAATTKRGETLPAYKGKLSDIKIETRNPDNNNAAEDVADALQEKYGKKFNRDKFTVALVGDENG